MLKFNLTLPTGCLFALKYLYTGTSYSLKKLQWCCKAIVLGAGHLESFFFPIPEHLGSLFVPTLGNFPIYLNNATTRGLAGEGRGGGSWISAVGMD